MDEKKRQKDYEAIKEKNTVAANTSIGMKLLVKATIGYLWLADKIMNNPVSNFIKNNPVSDFLSGFSYAYINNNAVGQLPENTYRSSNAYQYGKITGDVASIIQGGFEFLGGATIAGGGSFGLALTGVGIAAIPVAAVAGATMASHGVMVGGVAAVSLSNDIAYLKSGGSGGAPSAEGEIKTPANSPDDFTKLKNGQGWKDSDGNKWNKDKLHKDHYDISDSKGNKIKEVDYNGNQIWPNGPKNKNK